MLPVALGNDGGLADKLTHFGRYRIVRELGKGGMAQVFEARHTELDLRVALKVMRPALAAQPSAAARFLREARAACQIRHQHVVEVFDIGIDHGLPYIVMAFLEGSNLAELLAAKGPLQLSGIAHIFLPVISAVATAHAAGVIHRDLKPANLMLAQLVPRSLHPMVLDFGISKIANEELESTLTRSESLLGTIQYMAPELTKGAKFASAASDQYALGVMLYECTTGRRPFTGQSHYELMHAIVTAPVLPPSRIRKDLPPEFDALVEKAMHRDAAKRFSSVHALGSALLSFADRAKWALWEGEFVGTARDLDLWSTDGGTLHDASSGDRAGAPAQLARRTDATRRRLATRMLAPLGVYATIVTALLVQRSFETSRVETGGGRRAQTAAAERPMVPAPTPISMRASPEISSAPNSSPSDDLLGRPPAAPPMSPLTAERQSDDQRSGGSERASRTAIQTAQVPTRIELERALDAANPAKVQHAIGPAPMARKAKGVRPPSTPVLSPTGQAHMPAIASPKPPPPVHEGTNGAPIVD